MSTLHLRALFPGEFFIYKRDRPTSSWELVYRDDSRSTMDMRFNYQKETLKPGQAVRYETPTGELIEETEA
jgi:hypothetical protein